ncbi:hypothetical protein BU23DRAFT_528515 [Bimuria novae-zelandiae CBS 107.79]|uniref:Origin recognition complex subunit 4 n=1 Tax=Bimuria novae-zelandiae CBS 107.79 TaxID=1447943 RepID=A0A6A5VGJ3_9PLEO|nr:hypothetical protein BU23DRAFT_528515 [Bimuria novae-zelandiae CBS 107.79]
MDDSSRASKRRKFDTPTYNAPSSQAKHSTVRKSARTTRTTFKADGTPKEQETPTKSALKQSQRKTNDAGRQKEAVEDVDVWDDIEGALGESPANKQATKPLPSAKKRTTRKTVAEDIANESTSTDELLNATPSRRTRKVTSNGESASRSAFKSLVNGFRHPGEADAEEQDDLAAEVATPSRRASRRAHDERQAPNGTGSPVKPGSLRKPRGKARLEAASEVESTTALATPSSRRRRQSRFREDETIPETDDEPAKHRPSVPSGTSAKRRTTRTEHTKNQSEAATNDDGGEQAEAGAEEADDDAVSVDGNSILGSVLDPTEPSPFNKPSSAQKAKPDIPLLSGFAEPGRELDLLKTIVLQRISGKRPVPLVGLDDAYMTVHQLVENTVTAGEGNSMLLIGARGSGKTALVNKVLTEVSKDNSHDYHVVRLNGFIHTDDKIALREIWRQLGKEMDLDEEGGGVGKNYADTLTTLLALLSHPSEHTGEFTDQVAKAVVFVMDEFDLFAQHPRQTLLYNLFDIAQSRKAPIAVLGLTTRIDVANSLEKRVKSRFSHRYVHLSLAKTFTAFQETCKANLLIQPELLTVEERSILSSSAPKKSAKKTKFSTHTSVLSQWNANITTLFLSSTFLTTYLAPLFYTSKSIPNALTTFLLPAATLSTSLPLPTFTSHPPDSKLALIPHLSTLATALLIAAARLDIIHDSDAANFNMAYDEYVGLAGKARVQSAAGGNSATGGVSKVWGREVARREWEGLVELGLVVPVLGGGGGGAFAMVRCDVSLEEVGAVLAGMKGAERGLERWCRQL